MMKLSENNRVSISRSVRLIFTAIIVGLISTIMAPDLAAMPPHPDLADKIAEGKVEMPYYLAQRSRLLARGVDAGGESIMQKAGMVSKTGVAGYNILALLVDFSDNVASVAAVEFDTLIYVNTAGSVNNFYREVSYDGLSIVSAVYPSAIGWTRAAQTYAYYVNNNNALGTYPQNSQKLVEELVDSLDATIDFSLYDNDSDGYVDGLIIIHSGAGAEFTGLNTDIWSHKWGITPRLKDGVYISTYSINPEYWSAPGDITLGVYCHELGHILGLPDLYDTDYTSKGVGRWSLMAGGSWNGVNGNSPAHFDAWSRIFLGFVTPTVPVSDQSGVTIAQVETNPSIYKLWTLGAPTTEYFLVENRQLVGYDSQIPSSGLLIWHVDEIKTNNDSEWWPGSGLTGHYKVALEQADSLWELEKNLDNGDTGDPFPGISTNRSFLGSSNPNSYAYSGTGTSVSVVNISNSGASMTADIAIGSPQGIETENVQIPGKIRLLGNAPNPFNPETSIRFEVLNPTSVRIEIYGLTGEKIRVLTQNEFAPGLYEIHWDGKNSANNDTGSGIFFCKISTEDQAVTGKMIKLK